MPFSLAAFSSWRTDLPGILRLTIVLIPDLESTPRSCFDGFDPLKMPSETLSKLLRSRRLANSSFEIKGSSSVADNIGSGARSTVANAATKVVWSVFRKPIFFTLRKSRIKLLDDITPLSLQSRRPLCHPKRQEKILRKPCNCYLYGTLTSELGLMDM